jgi:MATE family multidrug resistance protein
MTADSGNLKRTFLRLSAINALSNLTGPMASLVDTAMLGHLDDVAFLAGVALASVVFDYLYWSFGFLRMSTTGLVALATGAEDPVAARSVLLQSLSVGLVVGLLAVATSGVLRDLGFALLSGDPEVEAVGRVYFDARIGGAPAHFANVCIVGYLLGCARSSSALAIAIVQNASNAALNVLFIVGLGMAARGAGLASMLSQYLALGLGLFLIAARGTDWRAAFRRARDPQGLSRLFVLNRDIFIRTLSMVTVFAVFTNLSAMGGAVQLAAFAVLIRILTASAYVVDGGAYAIETLAGTLEGAGRRLELRGLVRFAVVAATVFAALLSLLLFGAGESVYGILTQHREVVLLAVDFQGWLVACLFAGALAWILDGLFLGLTWSTHLRNAALISACAFAPLAWWAFSTGEPHYLWCSFFVYTLARPVTLGIALFRKGWFLG